MTLVVEVLAHLLRGLDLDFRQLHSGRNTYTAFGFGAASHDNLMLHITSESQLVLLLAHVVFMCTANWFLVRMSICSKCKLSLTGRKNGTSRSDDTTNQAATCIVYTCMVYTCAWNIFSTWSTHVHTKSCKSHHSSGVLIVPTSKLCNYKRCTECARDIT